ncbi:MAG TPA: hypothetical protein VKG44_01935 [Candidatus Baltobacteraceae bacterium]|nr:hypothetical protein [Candidatus Baltobacteraceae bacterium]
MTDDEKRAEANRKLDEMLRSRRTADEIVADMKRQLEEDRRAYRESLRASLLVDGKPADWATNGKSLEENVDAFKRTL